jgi:hypothetical protein
VIAVNFSEKLILIGGTSYAGEMKKSVFGILNYLLPTKGVMPMHCSANIGPDGDTAVFFGLSGTGKTTLSADASRTIADHVEHLQSIEALRLEARSLMAVDGDERMAKALRVYRHLALFVAENFQHMHIEETSNNAALWAHYSDAELADIHNRLLATVSPEDTMEVMRWMVPALNPVQRAGLLAEMKKEAPAFVFDAVIDVVRPHLDIRDWTKLARAVGVPQQAGLANFA